MYEEGDGCESTSRQKHKYVLHTYTLCFSKSLLIVPWRKKTKFSQILLSPKPFFYSFFIFLSNRQQDNKYCHVGAFSFNTGKKSLFKKDDVILSLQSGGKLLWREKGTHDSEGE